MTVWNGVGFNMILILAGLQTIAQELYEAAAIDGAGRLASFRRITLPMLSPVLFFILVKGAIGVFQLFDQPFVLTQGGPGDASRSILMYIYELAFKTLRLGYASSISLVLFGLILLLTLFQFAMSRRWVFYR
ncbi:sugar ABC transporter permease [Chloroflexi bacterium TSY]|nr:sugar ABC transporter permease [Chloroflexi bacterium TSY]